MKYLVFAVITILIGYSTLCDQQLTELCRNEAVAAVISNIKRPCKFRLNRKESRAEELRAKDDLHRKLSEGQQLQCAVQNSKKPATEGCVAVYLCGSRQYIPINATSPKWYTVINVPDRLPRDDTRPASVAHKQDKFSMPLETTASTSPSSVSTYVFRAANPTPGETTIRLSSTMENELLAGNDARDSGLFPVAMTRYQRVLNENPEDPRANQGLANLYLDQGKWREAEEHYRKAVRSNPALASAYASLSYVLLQSARGGGTLKLADAEAAAREAVRLQPINPVAYDLLGLTLEKQGEHLEAEAAYRQALQLKTDFAVAYLHLSHLLRTTGRSAEAERSYTRALSLISDAQSLMSLARALQNEDLFQLSETPLERVVATDAKNSEAQYLLARALVFRGAYERAVETLDKVLANERTFEMYRLQGFAHLKMSKPDLAEQAFAAAKSVGSDEQRKLLTGNSGLRGVADLYMKMGRTSDAYRIYAAAGLENWKKKQGRVAN